MFIAAKHGMYEVKADIVRALAIRFPLANVERELLLAALWLEKNPASRPAKPLRFIENWLRKVSPKAAMVDIKAVQWWSTESATNAMAAKLGMSARRDETWSEFRSRIAAKLREAA